MSEMTDYDAETMTVLADDGERMSVFDQDWCPACGDGGLSHFPASLDGDWGRPGVDQVLCLKCHFHAVRESVSAPLAP